MTTDYRKQGTDFLDATGTTLEVVEAVPQNSPQWAKEGEKNGIQYYCTLKNARGTYQFPFWGSIADAEMVELAKNAEVDSPRWFKLSDFLEKETGRKPLRMDAHGKSIIAKTREAVKPNAYDVLTCLHDDAGESFEDFCANYGYDEDSRTAEQVYHAVLEQERNMRKLFTHAELEKLAEIV